MGILNNNGERVDWAGGSYWVLEDVHTVHVVFMNHLDVGYNGIAQTGNPNPNSDPHPHSDPNLIPFFFCFSEKISPNPDPNLDSDANPILI